MGWPPSQLGRAAAPAAYPGRQAAAGAFAPAHGAFHPSATTHARPRESPM